MLRSICTTVAMAAALASPATAQDRAAVVATYADIGAAAFEDSLAAARNLRSAIGLLIDTPSALGLEDARDAWIRARVPYLQTEVFRFGNPVVDEWEGRVNAWPLDEGLIDYVDPAYGGATEQNVYAALNVIANPAFTLSGERIDAAAITPDLLQTHLREADDVESNVSTGYHAIEFLLWGQDLHGTGHGAGERPWTDYARGEACTNGHCERRAQYLAAAADLLVSDLDWMAAQWASGGAARKRLEGDPRAGVAAMLTGMGSLSYGELAGERMKLGVMLNDPEEEQDCFSDNTHNSHFYDGLGIRNVYHGEYVRSDGTLVSGPSLSDLVRASDPDVDAALSADLDTTMARLARMKAAAEAGFAYDQMLDRGSDAGEALIMSAVEALVTQTRSIERAVSALDLDGVGIVGSDSLDGADAVFQ